jgi:glycosyltransferase involved in cell wall biosynthesis
VRETPEVYDFYALSDVFVCASSIESFPLVLLEAMAFELPIVSTDVYGIPEMLASGKDALLVRPECPALLAERLHEILRDPALGRRLAQHAWRTLTDKFDNADILRLHARMYREVISARG